jgi:ComF family protein
MLIPVPLHKNRRRHRQFNQAEQLSRHLSLESGLPVENRALQRIVDSPTQTNLTRAKRYENLKNAFSVAQLDLVQGKRVVLIDDVLTSGATATHCAHELLKAGASEVAVCTVARTHASR